MCSGKHVYIYTLNSGFPYLVWESMKKPLISNQKLKTGRKNGIFLCPSHSLLFHFINHPWTGLSFSLSDWFVKWIVYLYFKATKAGRWLNQKHVKLYICWMWRARKQVKPRNFLKKDSSFIRLKDDFKKCCFPFFIWLFSLFVYWEWRNEKW